MFLDGISRVVIVDDNPISIVDAVIKLQSMGISDIEVYMPFVECGDFISNGNFTARTSIRVKTIPPYAENLVRCLESKYTLDKTAILMDYDLSGDITIEEIYRINMRYTFAKEYSGDVPLEERKIWVYCRNYPELVRHKYKGRVLLCEDGKEFKEV